MRPGEPEPRKTSRGRRIPGKLVAAGSALVLSIYTAGYLRTNETTARFDLDQALRDLETSASAPASAFAEPLATPTLEPTPEPTPEPEPTATPEPEPTATVVAAAQAAPPVPPTPRPAPVATATPRPPAPPAPPPAAIGGYRDGTFSGTGSAWNHGTLTVTVVIGGGQIVSAKVTGATIRYSSNDVDPLVAEAVRRQGVPLTNVSGATASCDGYKEAVIKALAQAR